MCHEKGEGGNESAQVAYRNKKDDGKPKEKSKDTRPKCSHCNALHATHNCYHLFPDKAPEDWEPLRACPKNDCRFHVSHRGKKGDQAPQGPPDMAFHAFAFAASTDSGWVVDSGSSSHMCFDLSLMNNVTPLTRTVKFGEGSGVAKGIGSVTLKVKAPNSYGFMNITFSNVLYLPGLFTNLISTQQLQRKGVFYSSFLEAVHTPDGTVVDQTFIHRGLPHLQVVDSTHCAFDPPPDLINPQPSAPVHCSNHFVIAPSSHRSNLSVVVFSLSLNSVSNKPHAT